MKILHAAQLSPVTLTQSLSDPEVARLFESTQQACARGRQNGKVTAFRPGMAAHGRYRQPCPRCGTPVQRIVYARTEANYCAVCQNGGRLLADRALSRLLRHDWPKTLEGAERARLR